MLSRYPSCRRSFATSGQAALIAGGPLVTKIPVRNSPSLCAGTRGRGKKRNQRSQSIETSKHAQSRKEILVVRVQVLTLGGVSNSPTSTVLVHVVVSHAHNAFNGSNCCREDANRIPFSARIGIGIGIARSVEGAARRCLGPCIIIYKNSAWGKHPRMHEQIRLLSRSGFTTTYPRSEEHRDRHSARTCRLPTQKWISPLSNAAQHPGGGGGGESRD